MGQHQTLEGAILAQADDPPPLAGPTIRRQRCNGRNPREEPDALAGTSGSARGAPGNRRPYRNLALMRRIDKLFLDYPFYGSRQMARHLWREGVRVGRHRVRRLMRLMGLQAIYQAPRTSQPHPQHPVYPYLLKGLAIERPNHVWCADIERHEAFLNLAVVRDHRRQPVAAG